MLSTLQWLVRHPLARKNMSHSLGRFLKWQAATRILNEPWILPFVGDARIIVKRGMTGATGNVYAGLGDFAEMMFLLHLLRKEDLFLDVGANVGTYTVLAAKARGATAIAFEPVPEALAHLEDNVAINRINELVTVYRCAISDKNTNGHITTALGPMNHLVDGGEIDETSSQCELRTLDSIDRCERAYAIKIDVEGHEEAVLNGASRLLTRPELRAAVVEVSDPTGLDPDKGQRVQRSLEQYGFGLFDYDPFRRRLCPLRDTRERSNAIFVRDVDTVDLRLKSGPAAVIPGFGSV